MKGRRQPRRLRVLSIHQVSSGRVCPQGSGEPQKACEEGSDMSVY